MRTCAITDKFLGFAMTLIIVASFLWVISAGKNFACGYDENATEEADISLVREAVELDATDSIYRIENDLTCDMFISDDDVFYGLQRFYEEDGSASDYLGNFISFVSNWTSESKALLISGAISFFLLQCLVFKKGTVAKNTASTITFTLFVGGLLYGLAG